MLELDLTANDDQRRGSNRSVLGHGVLANLRWFAGEQRILSQDEQNRLAKQQQRAAIRAQPWETRNMGKAKGVSGREYRRAVF